MASVGRSTRTGAMMGPGGFCEGWCGRRLQSAWRQHLPVQPDDPPCKRPAPRRTGTGNRERPGRASRPMFAERRAPEAMTLGSTGSDSRIGPARWMRTMAKQLLPPIVAKLLRRVRDRHSLEWEYRPGGWPDGDSTIHGWDAESVLAAQLTRWPAFVRSVEGRHPSVFRTRQPARRKATTGPTTPS
jgi:hypothetical protein